MRPPPPNLGRRLLAYFSAASAQRRAQLRASGWIETTGGWIHHIFSPDEPLPLEAAFNFRECLAAAAREPEFSGATDRKKDNERRGRYGCRSSRFAARTWPTNLMARP